MADTIPWATRIVGHGEMPPGELVPHPNNWRRHPGQQQRSLSLALGKVGWVQDVIVNRATGRLVDGHLRVELALERGEPTVPVTFVELSEDEERFVLMTLDPIGAMARGDRDLLAELGSQVAAADETVRGLVGEILRRSGARLTTGSSDSSTGSADGDAPVSRVGDLWLLGEHRLLCGDSTDPDPVGRLMGGEQAHLLATDPPYLVDYGSVPEGEGWDHFVDSESATEFYRRYLLAASPHLIEDAPYYQWHAHRHQNLVAAAWSDVGLLLHQVVIWSKPHAVPGHSHFGWQHEPCAYGWRGGHQPQRRPPPTATTIWPVAHDEREGVHPTEKPVELFAMPIAWHTLPGEICLEPFAGSGSQLIAAERQDRRCFALELEPRYVDAIVDRWQRLTGRLATLDGDGRTFAEIAEVRRGG